MISPSAVPAWAWVSLGGAGGATLRWALLELVSETAEAFPWTTFAINVVGCAALAWLLTRGVTERVRLLVGPGVLGGFTTLSAVSDQTRALLTAGHVALAAAYSLGTLLACLGAVALVRRVTGARDA